MNARQNSPFELLNEIGAATPDGGDDWWAWYAKQQSNLVAFAAERYAEIMVELAAIDADDCDPRGIPRPADPCDDEPYEYNCQYCGQIGGH